MEISLFNEAIHLEQIKTINPHEINEEFSVHPVFHVTMHVGDVPTNNKAPTHNHLIDSEEGLALETSPSQFSYGRGGSRGREHPPPPPLFLYQTDVRRAEKNLFLKPLPPPPPLSQGIDDRAPLPPYLEGLDLPLSGALSTLSSQPSLC